MDNNQNKTVIRLAQFCLSPNFWTTQTPEGLLWHSEMNNHLLKGIQHVLNVKYEFLQLHGMGTFSPEGNLINLCLGRTDQEIFFSH